MPAAQDNAAPLEFAKMTKIQKLAGLLIILGPESASRILQHLDDHELQAVSTEMTRMQILTQEVQEEILEEFSDVAVQASTALRGGIEYTQASLEKAMGLFKASNVINRVAPSRAPVAAVRDIVELESRQIFNLIKQEQPQTIALITSYLTPEKASQLMLMLRPELRELVLERLATLAPTPIEVVEKVVEVITQKLGSHHTRALSQTGGVKAAANVLNALDKNTSKSLLVAVEERNPELGQAIRQKMFTFEDLGSLESLVIQRILREVDMRDLAVALKTASENLKGQLLTGISKRAAETVIEEMNMLGPLRLRDIEAAQLRIIEAVRTLEASGEIEIGSAQEQRHEAALA